VRIVGAVETLHGIEIGIGIRGCAAHPLLRHRHRRLFDDQHRIVEVHGGRAARESIGIEAAGSTGVPGVELVDMLLGVFNEGIRVAVSAAVLTPIAGVQVLSDVDAMAIDGREQFLETDHQVFHAMPTVIDQHVDTSAMRAQLTEEAAIGLAADQDFAAGFQNIGAFGIDIDPDDARLRAQVLTPQLQRAAVKHADFDQGDGLSAKALQMAMVDVEVMQPFVDGAAQMGIEQGAQRVVRHQ
jgi:hypothetical protein